MASSARIDDLRKKFEENPRRYFAPLANEYRKAGEIEQAIAICREYLPQQPGHMSGHIVFGQALYEARQFDESKAVFETALTLDPENLIALRHLGDIALMTGDNGAARAWYRRVLDADPRNEEIQSQLALIDKADAASVPPGRAPEPPTVPVARSSTPTPVSTTVVEHPAVPRPTPSSAPTVVVSAMKRPVPPSTETPVDKPLETVTPESPTREIAATSEAQTAPTAEAPSLDISDLGMQPTAMSGGDTAPQRAEPSFAVESHMGGAAEAAPIDSFSLDGLETTSLAAPAVPAAPPTPSPEPSPPPAPTAELDFSTPAPAPPAPASEAPPTIELDIAPAAETPPPDAAPSAPTQDLPLLELEPAPAPAPQAPPASAAEEPPTPPQPFVTETMAELYLQQGHREKALEVFRAVLSQRPDDAVLRARIESLEATVRAAVSRVHTGPTIRDVLSRIALRRPGQRPAPQQTNGSAPALDEGGLTGLFSNAQPSDADEAAAMTLAAAFMESNGNGGEDQAVGAVAGEPARPAAGELSLDTVFGEAPPSPAASSSEFALNQYFSERATGEHNTTPPHVERDARDESPEEVAKFTQWLEGLKKR